MLTSNFVQLVYLKTRYVNETAHGTKGRRTRTSVYDGREDKATTVIGDGAEV